MPLMIKSPVRSSFKTEHACVALKIAFPHSCQSKTSAKNQINLTVSVDMLGRSILADELEKMIFVFKFFNEYNFV